MVFRFIKGFSVGKKKSLVMNVGGFSTEKKGQQSISKERDGLNTQMIRFFFWYRGFGYPKISVV